MAFPERKVNTGIIWVLGFGFLLIAFIYSQIDDMESPAAQFTGAVSADECSFTGLSIMGLGETALEAEAELTARKENYAYLYCNGKFKDDPADDAIEGLGCESCKPDCTPSLTELSEIIQKKSFDGKVIVTLKVGIVCK